MNIGHSSRLLYDDDVYEDKIRESTSPMSYRLNSDRIQNCNPCLSTLGPRSGYNGYGVSTTGIKTPATAQDFVELETVLSNRNLRHSKARSGRVNPIDVTKYQLEHAPICNNKLNPESSRLSYPAYNYRDASINRFYNLHRDPQANIFWDFAVNTSLEAKDNYAPKAPRPFDVNKSLPKEVLGGGPPKCFTCTDTRCPIRK